MRKSKKNVIGIRVAVYCNVSIPSANAMRVQVAEAFVDVRRTFSLNHVNLGVLILEHLCLNIYSLSIRVVSDMIKNLKFKFEVFLI